MSDLGNKEVMAENIKRYMAYYGSTATEICKVLNIKKGTFSTWVNAKAYPRIDMIEKMANHFHCTKADLVERFDESISIETRNALMSAAETAAKLESTLSTEIQFRNEEDLAMYKDLVCLMINDEKRKLLMAFVKGLSIS